MSKKRSRESEEFIETSARTIESELKKKRADQLAAMAVATSELMAIYVKLDSVLKPLQTEFKLADDTRKTIRDGLDKHFPKIELPATVQARLRRIPSYYNAERVKELEAEKAKYADYDAKKIAVYDHACSQRREAMKQIVGESTEKVPYEEYLTASKALKEAVESIRADLPHYITDAPLSESDSLGWNI
jgi:hypothetical protein